MHSSFLISAHALGSKSRIASSLLNPRSTFVALKTTPPGHRQSRISPNVMLGLPSASPRDADHHVAAKGTQPSRIAPRLPLLLRREMLLLRREMLLLRREMPLLPPLLRRMRNFAASFRLSRLGSSPPRHHTTERLSKAFKLFSFLHSILLVLFFSVDS